MNKAPSGILAMVVIAIAAVAFRIAFAQTEPSIPPDLLAALQRDSKTDELLKDCIEEVGALQLKDHLSAEPFDLGRRQKVWQVLLFHPCSGAQNGPRLLYLRVGNGWRMIAEAMGQGYFSVCTKESMPPCPSPKGPGRRAAGARDWPDLALWMHASATTGDQTVYRFDGRMYKAVCGAHFENTEQWEKPRYRCVGDR